MVAHALSPAVIGLQTSTVQVEVDLRAGLPGFSVVGLPDAAVQEARERVRSGLANQVFLVPPRRIVANLAPADLRKAGPQYDLPIALAVLAASGQLDPAALRGVGAVGELALDGRLRPVPGVLAMAEHAAAAGWRRLVVPAANAAEAALVGGVEVVGAPALRAAVDMLEGRTQVAPPAVDAAALLRDAAGPAGPDLADVRGQPLGRRALEVAAAGGHSLLLIGPPGGGKTMLARRLPGILPPLELDEAIALTRIHSVAGLLDPGTPLVTRRPFRAPHHTISAAGLVGGGRLPRPGEVSLAHGSAHKAPMNPGGTTMTTTAATTAPATLEDMRHVATEAVLEAVDIITGGNAIEMRHLVDIETAGCLLRDVRVASERSWTLYPEALERLAAAAAEQEEWWSGRIADHGHVYPERVARYRAEIARCRRVIEAATGLVRGGSTLEGCRPTG